MRLWINMNVSSARRNRSGFLQGQLDAEKVRLMSGNAMQGVVFSGDQHQATTEYFFSYLL
jgi:hypothetical protein